MLPLPASYRDPDGFVFSYSGKIYRFIKPSYFADYEKLMSGGLYKSLTEAGRLISHEDVADALDIVQTLGEGKIISPFQLPFISYPYEWSFEMWRDAAIVTLKTATAALEKGMMLKDATPFNIQFHQGRPVWIDTLSFEEYKEGKPWIAYRQFCECFLGPLLLMHYCYKDSGKLFLIYPDGIPLEVIKNTLPRKAKFNLHIYLHIWVQSKFSGKTKNITDKGGYFSEKKLSTLLQGLIDLVSNLKPKNSASEWADYYTGTVSGAGYLSAKKNIIEQFVKDLTFNKVIDLGANDGCFSVLLKEKAGLIIATDGDSDCINALYKKIRAEKITNIIPMVSVLHTPTPAIGWNNEERASLSERLKGDLVLALALVHHLAISKNIPMPFIAEWLSNMSRLLIIEFVPKSDEKVKALLLHREDIFPEYTLADFKNVFLKYFEIVREEIVGDTERVLFLMKRK